jgi:hypothetical protein
MFAAALVTIFRASGLLKLKHAQRVFPNLFVGACASWGIVNDEPINGMLVPL